MTYDDNFITGPVYCSSKIDKDIISFLQSDDIETLAWKVRMCGINRPDKLNPIDYKVGTIIKKYFVKDIYECEKAIIDAKVFFNIIPTPLPKIENISILSKIIKILKFI